MTTTIITYTKGKQGKCKNLGKLDSKLHLGHLIKMRIILSTRCRLNINVNAYNKNNNSSCLQYSFN